MSAHDFVAVGIGPFNLGLACLTAPLPDLDGVFLDAREEFDWHPGVMVPDATIQVPFLADLVTLADPTSEYSFLNHLKHTGRLYPFYIRESFFPLRAEYNAYCRWAAARVPGLRFGHRVERVEHDEATGEYVVHATRTRDGQPRTTRGRRLVLGVGTAPHLPPVARDLPGPAVHSSDYLPNRARLQRCESVTVVGSGQSAAEIYRDLLDGMDEHGYRLDWITRSPRFFPMEYTKLTLELTSPEHTAYFHALPPERRDRLNRDQRSLYKGISSDLVNEIFDALYRRSLDAAVPTSLLTCTELRDVTWDAGRRAYTLDLHHTEQERSFTRTTHALVLATGYTARVPEFLDPVRERIRWDSRGRYDVAAGYTVDHADAEIFVQNAEEHTHGLCAPDLGMGAHRNSTIIAAMLGREVYPVERRIAFQHFGALGDDTRTGRDARATGPVAEVTV